MRSKGLVLVLVACSFSCLSVVHSQEPPALELSIANGQQQIHFSPYASADAYKVFRADTLGQLLVEEMSGALSGFTWTAPLRSDSLGFYKLSVMPMAQNDLLAAIVLNRLAYGATPDELQRVKTMGAEAYIQEQLAPEKIDETLDLDQATTIPTTADWQFFSVTGTAGNTNFYVYLNVPGEGWIDDIKLVKTTS